MKWLFPTDICVVTGGNSGLGAAILQELAKQGCQTVSLDIINPTDSVEADQSHDQAADGGSVSTESCEHDGDSNTHSSTPIAPHENSDSIAAETDDDFNEEAAIPQDGETEKDLSPTLFIPCDVRNQEQLQQAREIIFKKFNRYPSVIVLNAGIRRPIRSIVESDYADLQDTLDVNLGGTVKCLRAFLPDLISNERGFIISIASALGIVVPKGLGVYGASKAGMIGIHEALEQELSSYKDVHALLVCPGQLDTSMFSDVKTPSTFLAPVVSPSKLAEKIVKRLIKASTSTLYVPTYVRYLPFMHSLPVSLARLTRKLSGIDKVYDDITSQRQNEDADNLSENGTNSVEQDISESSQEGTQREPTTQQDTAAEEVGSSQDYQEEPSPDAAESRIIEASQSNGAQELIGTVDGVVENFDGSKETSASESDPTTSAIPLEEVSNLGAATSLCLPKANTVPLSTKRRFKFCHRPSAVPLVN